MLADSIFNFSLCAQAQAHPANTALLSRLFRLPASCACFLRLGQLGNSSYTPRWIERMTQRQAPPSARRQQRALGLPLWREAKCADA